MPRVKEWPHGASLHLDPVVSAAWLYYHLELTQAEVAEALGVSRTTVVNMLAEARAKGIVTIRLEPDYLAAMDAAQAVRERFGLRDALVVPTPGSLDALSLTAALGKACALYLEKTLEPGEILATGWGLTLLEAARALSSRAVPDLTVAQLLGGFSNADAFNPSKVASLIADKLHARLYHLYLPASVASPDIRDILLQDPAIHSAFEMAKSADCAVVGIGKVGHDATVVKAGFVSGLQMDEFRAKGAVGDLISRFFDLKGRPVKTAFDDRLTGLTFEDFRRIRRVVAVAGGEDKVEAVLGALRSGYLHVLISDARTVQQVLALDERTGG